MKKMGYVEYMQYVENQEIDNGIATLQRVEQELEQTSKSKTLTTCGFDRNLPFKEVEKVFGKFKSVIPSTNKNKPYLYE